MYFKYNCKFHFEYGNIIILYNLILLLNIIILLLNIIIFIIKYYVIYASCINKCKPEDRCNRSKGQRRIPHHFVSELQEVTIHIVLGPYALIHLTPS